MLNLTSADLSAAGLSDAEIRRILSRSGDETLVRQLRRSRSRQLEEIHIRQQALDRLDYLIHRIRKEG